MVESAKSPSPTRRIFGLLMALLLAASLLPLVAIIGGPAQAQAPEFDVEFEPNDPPANNVFGNPDPSDNRWINRYSHDIIYENGTHTTSIYIGPQVFWNGSEWQELNFEDRYATDGYYLMQNAHITAKIYDWYSVFLDPDNQRVCVDDERWIVEVYNEKTGKWREVDLYNPSLSYSDNGTHLTVTRTFDCPEGLFEVSYIIRQGSRLKHDVVFKSRMEGSNQFRATMKLAGIHSDKVRHSGGEETITGEKYIVSPYFFIGENNSNLVLSEYLWSLGTTNEETGEWTPTTLKDIVLDTHAKGSKADIIIGNYTLVQGESLLIDPDSDTWQVVASTDDAHEQNDGLMQVTNTTLYCRSFQWGIGYRFPVVSIPQGATITAAYYQHFIDSFDDPHIDIYAEDVDTSTTFTTTAHDLSNRTRTTAKTTWEATNLGTSDWVNTPSVISSIQEVINRAEWNSGNALTAICVRLTSPDCDYEIRAYDYGGHTEAPKLKVTWTSAAVLGKPVLVSPENNHSTSDNTPTFVWENGSDATSHRLVIDNSQDFDDGENIYDNASAWDNSGTAIENELPVDNYWWKVCATNAEGDNWSDIWTFEIIEEEVGAPKITVPRVFASVYTKGESGTVWAQVLDTNGDPVNAATVTLTVWEPDGDKYLDAVSMGFVTGSNGIYKYAITAPSEFGTFLCDVTATWNGSTAYGCGEFQVASWAENILSILDNLIAHRNAVEATISDIEAYVDTLESGQSTIIGHVDTLESGQSTITGYVDTIETVLGDPTAHGYTDIADALGVIDNFVDQVEGYTDTLESGQSTITGHVDTLEEGQATITDYVDTLETSQVTITAQLNWIADYLENTMKPELDSILDNVQNNYTYLSGTIKPQLDQMRENIDKTLDNAVEVYAYLTGTVKPAIDDAYNQAVTNYDYLTDTIKPQLDNIQENLTATAELPENIMDNIFATYSFLTESIKPELDNVYENVNASYNYLINTINPKLDEIAAGVGVGLSIEVTRYYLLNLGDLQEFYVTIVKGTNVDWATITLEDPKGTLVVDNTSMSNPAVGSYYYSFSTSGRESGGWLATIVAKDENLTTTYRGFWRLGGEGEPVGYLTLTLLDNETNEPIEGAKVELYRTGTLVESKYTRWDGKSFLDIMNWGIHELKWSKDGYETETMEIDLTVSSDLTLKMVPTKEKAWAPPIMWILAALVIGCVFAVLVYYGSKKRAKAASLGTAFILPAILLGILWFLGVG